MKILSWNINGIRAAIKKGLLDFLKKEQPDVLCLQEIKIATEARQKELAEVLSPEKLGYQLFWNSAKRPGYSGTMTLVKKGIKVRSLPHLKWDDEGRIQVLEFAKFYLSNVYFPNANHELSRLNFKIAFNDNLLGYLKKIVKGKLLIPTAISGVKKELKVKPLIICGDYNVAHKDIDLARPKQNVNNPGFTSQERAWMDKFLQQGFIDIFRFQHPDKIQYSWWSYRAQVRAKNIGWRIDYFCISNSAKNKIIKSFIKTKVMGSDHCPIGILANF